MINTRVLWHIPRRLREAEISLLSTSLGFSTIISIVPFLAVAFAVLHQLAGFETLSHQFEIFVLGFFKETAGAETSALIKKILLRLSKVSWTVTSAAALLVTSSQIFFAMELAVNRIWRVPRRRALWKRIGLVLIFFFLVPMALAIYAGLRSANFFIPLIQLNPLLWDGVLGFLMLFLANRFLPAQKVQWKPAALGAAFSAVGLFALEGTFSWLAKKVFNYSLLYGSLAALPLLCLWILIAWHIVLLGVALAAGLQNPAAHRRI